MHHWLLVLYTGLDKTRVARTYRFSTIKQIAHAVGSTTTVVSNTVHRLILPRDNLRYCTIRKVDTMPIRRCAGRHAGASRLLGRLQMGGF